MAAERPIRRWGAAAAAGLLLVSGSGLPCKAQAQPRPAGARAYAFSFVDADIPSVANEVLGEALKLPYTVDPAVQGKISLRIERRLTPDQLFELFEAAVAQANVAVVRGPDGVVALVPKDKARSGRSLVSPGAGARAGYRVVAETLKYATPSEIAKILSATGAADLVVQTDDRRGLLVLSGSSAEIRAAEATIALLDRSSLGDGRLRVVALHAGSAEAVAADLQGLLKAADFGGVTLVPLSQANEIVIFARSSAALDQVEAWVRRLDRPSSEEPTTLWVYKPRNISADSLAEALRSLSALQERATITRHAVDGATPTTPKQIDEALTESQTPPHFDPDALKVSVEKSTNSLLVMAPASRWHSLELSLQQLDRAPDQVLIEATVLEVTLNRDFQFGVDWAFVSANGKLSGVLSSSPTGAVQSTFPGLSVTYLNTGVKAVVNALASRTDVEVMSAPKLVALDNQTASLQVGDQVPVVVQQSQGTGAPGAPVVVNTQYRDTGVILKIKPRINGDHTVLVDLSQEVSSVAKTTTSGIDSPTIQQRKFESSLQIPEGQTVALGGLISSGRDLGNSGVPLLKDIPLAGALFRTSSSGVRRTELIVLLSARILRAGDSAEDVAQQLKGTMHGLQQSGLASEH
jgi:general secretion pathway protein D